MLTIILQIVRRVLADEIANNDNPSQPPLNDHNRLAALEKLGSSTSTEQFDSPSKKNNYGKWRSNQGGVVSPEKETREVACYAREDLFKFVKFITTELQLYYTGKNS